MGTGHIYGKVNTGPGGTVTVDSNGGVGDYAWSSTHPGEIQSGMVSDDMNVAFADQALPSSWSPVPPSGGSYNGTNYTYVLNDGQYTLGSVYIGTGMSILAKGDCILYVNGNFKVRRNGFVYCARQQPETYVSGSGTISGGGIVNSTQRAANMSYIGLPTSTTLTIGGSAAFIGTINAPQVDFTYRGSNPLLCPGNLETFYNSGIPPYPLRRGWQGRNLGVTSPPGKRRPFLKKLLFTAARTQKRRTREPSPQSSKTHQTPNVKAPMVVCG